MIYQMLGLQSRVQVARESYIPTTSQHDCYCCCCCCYGQHRRCRRRQRQCQCHCYYYYDCHRHCRHRHCHYHGRRCCSYCHGRRLLDKSSLHVAASSTPRSTDVSALTIQCNGRCAKKDVKDDGSTSAIVMQCEKYQLRRVS